MLPSLIVDFTDFLSLWLGLRRLIAILRACWMRYQEGRWSSAKTFSLSVAVYTDAYMNM
jgi:hypothetical protein